MAGGGGLGEGLLAFFVLGEDVFLLFMVKGFEGGNAVIAFILEEADSMSVLIYLSLMLAVECLGVLCRSVLLVYGTSIPYPPGEGYFLIDVVKGIVYSFHTGLGSQEHHLEKFTISLFLNRIFDILYLHCCAFSEVEFF